MGVIALLFIKLASMGSFLICNTFFIYVLFAFLPHSLSLQMIGSIPFSSTCTNVVGEISFLTLLSQRQRFFYR
ncbi:hypothetical protein HCUR_00458 [Holospora curviuscula]|uniref:Uncharacterized protein n=1 Tax=Holospora curviuscula TaxID=1082868 RepID=A0A2S5RAE1_9PROT|nr:hypothetical protein HCUR_00458 [Holospora curviuscula]